MSHPSVEEAEKKLDEAGENPGRVRHERPSDQNPRDDIPDVPALLR